MLLHSKNSVIAADMCNFFLLMTEFDLQSPHGSDGIHDRLLCYSANYNLNVYRGSCKAFQSRKASFL